MPCWCQGNCPHRAEPAKALKEGRQRQAEAQLRRSLTEAPHCIEANLLLAEVMNSSNRPSCAEVHLQRAAKVEGRSPRIQIEIARNLRLQAKPAASAAAYEIALGIAPKNPHAWGGFIGALEAEGRLDAAVDAIGQAKTQFPELPIAIRFQAATALLANKDPTAAIAMLEKQNITPAERLLRGRAKEALGDYAAAWADWSGAKYELAEKQGHVYWREHFAQLFSGLAEISQPARFRLMTPAPDLEAEPMPLFVSGFPRSGTTMLETALAAHSQIVDGDELPGINEVVQSLPRAVRTNLPYPQCLVGTTLGDNGLVLTMMRDLYWRKSQEKIGFKFGPAGGPKYRVDDDEATWAMYFTDKMPMNDLHLPLIRLLFPKAPFIYIKRHPLDVFVSCMSHMLAHGGHYAQSLETLAEHYAGAYAVRQHYKNVLDMTHYREVAYESLVADFAGELAPLLQMMGLEIEPACVAFHESARQSHTISYRQIKQPLYKSSVARYKNYMRWLEPAFSWIEPILKREGLDL